MSCCYLEDGFVGGMVDGDLDIDLGNLYIAHHTVAGQVQAGEVFFVFFLVDLSGGEGVGEDIGKQGFVIGVGLFPFVIVIDLSGFCFFGDDRVVSGDQAALAVVVPLVGEEWVQQQGQAGEE